MAQDTSDPPWLSLPAEVSRPCCAPSCSDIVEAIIEGIPRDVPVYAMPMEGRFGQGVRQGVTIALNRFLDLPGTRLPALSEDGKWVYESLGRGEVRSGRSLESLLAAYRYGARVTFRAISRTVDVSQMPPDALLALGESLFAYIDELSAASAQGYAQEQSERAGEQLRLRAELLEMILRGDSSDGGRATPRRGRRLDPAGGRRGRARAVPARRRAARSPRAGRSRRRAGHRRGHRLPVRQPLGAAVASSSAPCAGAAPSSGPPRPWQQAGESLHLATSAGRARRSGRGRTSPTATRAPVWVEDHLAELVVHAEPLATDDLARTRLAPLDGLRPAVRERLTETLLSWLRHQGQRAPIAEELFVHQQTVGYRVAQLKELFGDALDDPEVRFELELVLRAGHR